MFRNRNASKITARIIIAILIFAMLAGILGSFL